MKALNKKGQLTGPLQNVVGIVFVLFFLGILVFSFALAGSSMISATTDATAINIINKTLQGAESFADFSPTLWIMAAVAALLTILIGAVGVFFLQRSK